MIWMGGAPTNLDVTVWVTGDAGRPSAGPAHNALASGILARRRHTWNRCSGRPLAGRDGLRDIAGRGFPQIRAGCAACRGFWLDHSKEVRLEKRDGFHTAEPPRRLLQQQPWHHSSTPSQLAIRSKIRAVSWPAWTPTSSVSSLPGCACLLRQ